MTNKAEIVKTEVDVTPSAGVVPSLEDMKESRGKLLGFFKKEMKEGLDADYANIPGTQGPSLLKPGAEKLLRLFGLFARLEAAGESKDKEELFLEYVYRCDVVGMRPTPDGSRWQEIVVTSYFGSSNTKEKCYARELVRNGMLAIAPNVRAKAMKRALVGAARVACNASDIFSQSAEDQVEAEENRIQPMDPERERLLKSVKPMASGMDGQEWEDLSVKALGPERVAELKKSKLPWVHITTVELYKIQQAIQPEAERLEQPDPNQRPLFAGQV